MKITVGILCLTLCGCTTLERHPILSAVLVGSVAAMALDRGASREVIPARIPPNPCQNPEACR